MCCGKEGGLDFLGVGDGEVETTLVSIDYFGGKNYQIVVELSGRVFLIVSCRNGTTVCSIRKSKKK